MLAGVHSVLVALLSEKADVQYYPGETDPDRLLQAIKELGFGASLIPDQEGYQQGKLDLTVSSFQIIDKRVIMELGLGLASSQIRKATSKEKLDLTTR